MSKGVMVDDVLMFIQTKERGPMNADALCAVAVKSK